MGQIDVGVHRVRPCVLIEDRISECYPPFKYCLFVFLPPFAGRTITVPMATTSSTKRGPRGLNTILLLALLRPLRKIDVCGSTAKLSIKL